MTRSDLVEIFSNFALGLRRGTVDLIPYEEKWAEAFYFLRDLLHELLPERCQYHHIGSTALPGCYAKPILDILIVFDQKSDFSEPQKILEQIGFTYKGDYGIPERRFFTLYDETETMDFVHLHAFPVGNINIDRLLEFKRCLQGSPMLVKKYSEMKLNLKEQGVSRKDYPEAKSDWIMAVLKE